VRRKELCMVLESYLQYILTNAIYYIASGYEKETSDSNI
jgi:hypothetical protein